MVRNLFLIAAIAAAFSAKIAVAEDCDSSCSAGEVMVSFLDGNNVYCQCFPQANMSDPPVVPSQCDGGVADCG